MKVRDLQKTLGRKLIYCRQKLSITRVRPLINNSSSPRIFRITSQGEMDPLDNYGFSPTPKELDDEDSSGSRGCLNCCGCLAEGDSAETLPMDFFKNTSLHGLKYIGQKKQHVVEKIFWSIAFIIGLIVAYYMISDVWEKYSNNSVIITFAPFDTKIEEIPFPAITICSMNKILKSKAKQFMEESKGSSWDGTVREARENLYYLNHVCSSSKSFTRTFNFSEGRGKIDHYSLHVTNRNENNYDGGKEDLWQFFLKASPSCSQMILKCTWQEEVKNCEELFTEIETDYGKCCTANMVPPSVLYRFNETSTPDINWWNWDGDSLLNKPKTKKEIGKDQPKVPLDASKENSSNNPNTLRRQKVPGKSYGLSVLLDPGLDEYFCTTSDSVGFRLVAHLPIDFPHIGDLGSGLKPNSEVFINLRPEVTIGVKDAIKDFSLEQRQCYFNEEHKLGYYNFYSSNNCIDECIANLTYQECNCRRHFQPGDDSKPLCGPKQFHCASNIKKKFVENYKTQCQMCIPTCTEIVYHTETTYTALQDPEILWTDSKHNLAPWATKNTSIVHIYFGEGSTNAKLRKELYSTVGLIANFGGLMGLCLGFSGLSVIEVLYFLTLRAWCRVRQRRQRRERSEKCWRNGMPRSDTTTELLRNEIACVPLYRTPPLGLKHRSTKDKDDKLGHLLYTVAFSNKSSNP